MDKQLKILVADDERSLTRALEIKFKKEGFDVVVAHDGEEALKAIDATTFDLVILDLLMPKLSGFEVLTVLKDKGVKVPIIVASNLGLEAEISKAKTLGAVDFFIKSNISISDLVVKIKKFLGIEV